MFIDMLRTCGMDVSQDCNRERRRDVAGLWRRPLALAAGPRLSWGLQLPSSATGAAVNRNF